jgi:TetR/AcrR family transcriptional repressor of nem operon
VTAKAEQKRLSHETILQSGARLLRERGISGARVAEVMEGAGLTVGGFYAHFRSKTDLIDEVLRRAGAQLRDRLFARLDQRPPRDRVEVILKRYLSPAHRELRAEGCPLPAVVGEISTTAPEHGRVVGEQVEAIAAGIQAELPASRPIGRRQLALGLVALMYGGLSIARALRGTALSNEMLNACRALGTSVARGGARK